MWSGLIRCWMFRILVITTPRPPVFRDSAKTLPSPCVLLSSLSLTGSADGSDESHGPCPVALARFKTKQTTCQGRVVSPSALHLAPVGCETLSKLLAHDGSFRPSVHVFVCDYNRLCRLSPRGDGRGIDGPPLPRQPERSPGRALQTRWKRSPWPLIKRTCEIEIPIVARIYTLSQERDPRYAAHFR
jgi:hypothetical protein